MDDLVLDAEESRRRHVVTKMRHNDMGEQATNLLMEKLSDNPALLDEDTTPPSSPREDARGFNIKETNQRGTVVLQTRIATLEMSDVMAARLRSLYVTHQPVELLTPRYLEDFARAAFLLLYRYSYVDPGFKRQGYLGPQYFEAISQAFNMPVDLECFAAAFNTTVPQYCSLFPDVESPFGSLGSFFDLENLGDHMLVQCSPPRIGEITKRAVAHCKKLIDREKGSSKVYYIVFLSPAAWVDVTRQLEDTGVCVWYNRVKPGDTILYHDVVRNLPARYPMPQVSVLSNHRPRSHDLTGVISQRLHAAFSSRRS